MNAFLWILQIIIALHTIVGAAWKLSNSAEQTMPSLKAIPNRVWLALSFLEILISLCLVVPALYMPLAILAPMAATCLVAEMLLFCGLHISSRDPNNAPLAYWLVVAALCAFLAYGRFALSPF